MWLNRKITKINVRAPTANVGYVPNAKYLAHIPHQKLILSNVPNLKKFATCKQYHCKFAMVRTKNGIIFIVFLFCFLSPLSSVYSFLFSLTSLQFIRFSSLSPLFSTKNGINLHRFSSLSRHRRSIITDLSSIAFCIVITDLSGHRHCHRRSESTWASTLR